jgi:hypothetical protein
MDSIMRRTRLRALSSNRATMWIVFQKEVSNSRSETQTVVQKQMTNTSTATWGSLPAEDHSDSRTRVLGSLKPLMRRVQAVCHCLFLQSMNTTEVSEVLNKGTAALSQPKHSIGDEGTVLEHRFEPLLWHADLPFSQPSIYYSQCHTSTG